MKKILSVCMTVAIPVLLLLTVLQSAKYNRLQNELDDCVAMQEELITGNAKKISAIAILQSPQRIEKIAVDDLNMKKADPADIIRVSIKP